jgi:hypothetical protein
VSDEEQPKPRDLRKLRPWYLIVAMSLMWLVGVFGATAGCADMSYLRGEQVVQEDPLAQLEEGSQWWLRMVVVAQKARLDALAQQYERAFPLSTAHLLLCLLLVLAAGSAIVGRTGARHLALQAIAANAALAAVAFVLMAPVRQTVAEVVGDDAMHNGMGVTTGATREQTVTLYLDSERYGTGFKMLMFAVAGLALTRPRTKEWFDAIEAAVADGERP